MKDDPRVNNIFFNNASIADYLSDYADALKKAINTIDVIELENAFRLLSQYSLSNNDILTIGNGGSHAIADHLSCDFSKGTFINDNKRLKVIPLGSLASLHSAAANDFGHENAFAQQIKFLGSRQSLLIAISSSGNSQNIIKATKHHQSNGGRCIALTGFDGGALKEMADISLHVDSNNYGIVEDSHQSIIHILAQYIYLD